MAELGINVAGRAEQSPAAIAALGATWCRAVAYPDADITNWVRDCQAHGVKVLLVLARESIGDDTEQRLAMFARRYGGVVNAVQVGNESDHVSDSSWTMTPRDLNRLLMTARAVFGPDKLLIGPGLVSGQPSWAGQIDWSPVDALCLHPYAKWPGTPELSNLIDGYAAYGKPLWVTEYHARTLGMAAALRNDPRLGVAIAFCYSDSMVPGFGLVESPAALADFKAAAGTPRSPVDQPVRFQLGFLEWSQADPSLLGQPLENERGGVPGFSVQKTSTGRLMASNLVNRGWTLTFWRDSDGARFLFANGRSEQIA